MNNICVLLSCRKKVTIHVPYRVRKVKHTHTIYKVMPRYEHNYHDKEDTDNDDTYDV